MFNNKWNQYVLQIELLLDHYLIRYHSTHQYCEWQDTTPLMLHIEKALWHLAFTIRVAKVLLRVKHNIYIKSSVY